MEIWKNIEDYQDYQVSNLARVKSLKFGKVKYLKLNSSSSYPTVQLFKKGKGKTHDVHVLVAIAFLGHKPNGYDGLVVDHINEDKTNPKADNLQLLTVGDNVRKSRKECTSKYIGVYWDKKRKIWIAQICKKHRTIYVGSFKNEIDAYNARQLRLN